nr:MAG TPA: hypothetical protein [Caudoviricetes sp.]
MLGDYNRGYQKERDNRIILLSKLLGDYNASR